MIGLPGSGLVTLLEETSFCISEARATSCRAGRRACSSATPGCCRRWELTVDGQEPAAAGGPARRAVRGHVPRPRAAAGRPGRQHAAGGAPPLRRRRHARGHHAPQHRRRGTVRCTLELARGRRLRRPVRGQGPVQSRAPSVSVHAADSGAGDHQRPPRPAPARRASIDRRRRTRRSRDGTLTWRLSIPGHGERTVSIEVMPGHRRRAADAALPARAEASSGAVPAKRLRKWRRRGPQVRTADPAPGRGARPQRRGPRRAAHLRPRRIPRRPRGGGRRALVHDPVRPGLAAHRLDDAAAGTRAWPLGTLQTLARFQGTEVDPRTEEEPGRILHEMRFGAAASLRARRRQRLLRHRRRHAAVRDAARRAAAVGLRATPSTRCCRTPTGRWSGSSSYGDRDGDGFVEYQRTTDHGLANQGWKDSWDGISFADGTHRRAADRAGRGPGLRLRRLPGPGRTWRRSAGDTPTGAGCWRKKATQLKRRFNERLLAAATGAGSPSASTATSGRSTRSPRTWATACGPASSTRTRPPRWPSTCCPPTMFSGWGIRTLAAVDGAPTTR